MKKIILTIAAALMAFTPGLAFAYTANFDPGTNPVVGPFTVNVTDVSEDNFCGGGGRTPNWTMQAFIGVGIGDPDQQIIYEISSNYMQIDSGQPFDFTFNFPTAINAPDAQLWVSCNNNDPPDATLGYSSFIFTHIMDAAGTPPSDQPISFELPPLPNQGAWGVAMMMMSLAGIFGILAVGFSKIF